jgi:D-alanyl-D-alanine carboxypeptidase/D-alanyl-D-alanine-endopeptidase (penicillin-binding protein 4)
MAALVFSALSVAASCAKSPPTTAAGPNRSGSTTTRDDLGRSVQQLLTDPAVDHANWAVLVRSLSDGATVFSLNAHKFLVPASNQKVLTSAAAAERLGWDYRYTTRILATGPIKGGTLEGDLVVVGNGDPSINPRHEDRWGVFDRWADQLAGRGIRIVDGRLIGDDNAFAEPGWGDGWAWDDIAFGYGAPVSALQYHENELEILVGPGMETGARAIISSSPLGSGMTIDHGVTTVAAGSPTRITQQRVPGSNLLRLSGQVALDGPTRTVRAGVENPTLMYVNALREALGRHGIFVSGGTVDVDDLRTPPALDGATEMLVDRSPPLSELVDVTLKWSRNLYAETLLYSLSPPDAPATAASGLRALQDTLGTWGVAADWYLPRDGSGLSRYDYLTPNALVSLLTHLWNDPRHKEMFRGTLPVAGVAGSIADRLKGTAAEGRVWAKTGSMSQVRSLAGYLQTQADEPMVFAILVNGFRVPASQIDEVVNNVLLHLIAFRR